MSTVIARLESGMNVGRGASPGPIVEAAAVDSRATVVETLGSVGGINIVSVATDGITNGEIIGVDDSVCKAKEFNVNV